MGESKKTQLTIWSTEKYSLIFWSYFILFTLVSSFLGVLIFVSLDKLSDNVFDNKDNLIFNVIFIFIFYILYSGIFLFFYRIFKKIALGQSGSSKMFYSPVSGAVVSGIWLACVAVVVKLSFHLFEVLFQASYSTFLNLMTVYAIVVFLGIFVVVKIFEIAANSKIHGI